MKIGVAGSMQFIEQMLEVRNELVQLGHTAFLNDMVMAFVGKTPEECDRINVEQKQNHDIMREFWKLMQDADAIVVCNYDKRGISNYIGGNSFLEMGFCYVLNQKLFLLNPIPEVTYKTEIEAMKPVILNGNLSLVSQHEPSKT